MLRPVNLMRWREHRRRNMLRFWGLMFSAPALIALALAFGGRATLAQSAVLQAVYARGEAQRQQALTQREQALMSHRTQREKGLRREQRRQQTLFWQSGLRALANCLPEQAWLTALSWQNGVLHLRGAAARFNALPALDRALRALPGYCSVTSGATSRGSNGLWQFSYTLVREPRDAGAC